MSPQPCSSMVLVVYVSMALFLLLSPLVRALPLAPAPERSANLTQCRDNILHHSLAYEPYLVNMDRQRTSNDSEVVGSDLGTCKAYCGTSSSSFQWSSFSSQFAGWLLPFLALTAQLPFESKGTWHNFMCLFLTVGSPQLAMYSLALTILNSRYVKKLLDTLPTPKEDEERLQLDELKESIFQAFRFSQQEPFALVTYDAASVVDLATLRSWWRSVRHCLARNSRWFTASLATQAAWAIIAFGFTWVDAFGSPKFGTNVTAFGLAISLCWSWVAVIVLGWFFAGVSFMSFPVTAAIEQADAMHPNAFPRFAIYQRPPNRRNPSHYFLLRRIAGDAEHNGPIYNYARVLVWSHMVYHVVEVISRQLGQQTQPQLVQSQHIAPSGEQGEDEQHELQRVPTSVSSEIRRSNVALGVSQGSMHMHQTERRTTLPVIEYELVGPLAGDPEGDEFWRPDSPSSATQSSATPLHPPSSVGGDGSCTFLIPPTTRIAERTESTESNQGQQESHHQDQLLAAASTLNLAHVQVAQNSVLENESQRSPLSPNADINPRSIVLPIVTRYLWEDAAAMAEWKHDAYARMRWALVCAVILSTFTVGMSFSLDFVTPAIGLGCRSGGMLIYWMTSYVVMILLVLAARLSDQWSAHEATVRHHGIREAFPRKTFYRLLGILAVSLRLFGKLFAVLNSVWILVHCIFEFTRFYDRCYCLTNRGTTYWLWLDDEQIRALGNTERFWVGFASTTGVVCLVYIVFMGAWTTKRL